MERDTAKDLDTLVAKLKSFGLPENEAKVYSALLLKSPLRPSEVSEMSGVARAEVHRHLHSLEKRGFCLVVAGESKRYAAIPPDVVLSSIIQQEKKRKDAMKRTKEQLVSDLMGLQRLGAAQNGIEKFQVLRDIDVVLERGTKMIYGAKMTARIILHEATIQSYLATGILQNLDSLTGLEGNASKPKADIRILFVASSSGGEGLKDTLSKTGFPVDSKPRWIPSSMMETLPDMIISDDRELFLRISPIEAKENGTMKDEIKAVLTNMSSMIKPFTYLFEQNWNAATDFE